MRYRTANVPTRTGSQAHRAARPRQARHLSIPDYQGQGIGSGLLKNLIILAKEKQFHTMISVITEGNAASVQLHEKFHFQFCGELKEVGFKHNRWLNISFYQKLLTSESA